MYRNTFTVATRNKGLVDISDKLNTLIRESGKRDGMLHLFLHHTSASLLINEGADPRVCTDLERWLERLVEDGDPLFEHREEGDDDMSAHVRVALTTVTLTLPVVEGKLGLGRWQRVFLWEHRHGPMERDLTVTIWN